MAWINNHRGTLLASAVFVCALAIVGIKLLTPAPIQIYLDGREAVVKQIHGLFTFDEVLAISLSAALLGASASYLVFVEQHQRQTETNTSIGSRMLEEKKAKWTEVANGLKDDEQVIYWAVVESDGIINQSDLVVKVGMSKSNVSRALDMLESRSLVERRRRGMGNVVLLK